MELSFDPRIVRNPDICNGRPVISGTRITVQTIQEMLGAGDRVEDVLDAYPTLSLEDVQSCQADVLEPIPSVT